MIAFTSKDHTSKPLDAKTRLIQRILSITKRAKNVKKIRRSRVKKRYPKYSGSRRRVFPFVSFLLRLFYVFVLLLWRKIGAFLYKSTSESDLRGFSVSRSSMARFLYCLSNDTAAKTCYNGDGSESIRRGTRSDTLEETEEAIEYESFFTEDNILWSIVLF